MSENYSRRNHSSKEEKKSAPKVTEHVTKGFTAFQKVLTAVGTILSIIVASITIMNFTASKNKDTSDSSANQSTVVIKEGNNKNQAPLHLVMAMRLIQKHKQVAKQELTPIRHLQTQQRVAIRLPLHQQLLQTQHLAMRLLVAQQLVTPLLTKTCKRLGNPAFFL